MSLLEARTPLILVQFLEADVGFLAQRRKEGGLGWRVVVVPINNTTQG